MKGPEDVVLQHCIAFRDGGECCHATEGDGLLHLTPQKCKEKQKEQWRDFHSSGVVPARTTECETDSDRMPDLVSSSSDTNDRGVYDLRPVTDDSSDSTDMGA